MLTAMKAKLALLVHTKVGATVLAAVLVAGGGSAVALAATHGNLGSMFSSSPSATHTTTTGKDNDSATNHESMEGTLKSYTAPSGTTAGSITVQPSTGSAVNFQVTKDTAVNGTVNGYHEQNTETETGGGRTIGQHTEGTPSARSDNGEDQPGSLSNLAAAIGHKVQVQANKSGSNWVAGKVTIESAPGDQGDGQGDNQSRQVVAGKVKSIGTTSFIVTTLRNGAPADVTVDVDSTTHFSGAVSSLGRLKVGMLVLVVGMKNSDGSVQASMVMAGDAMGPGDGGHSPSATPSPHTSD